MDFCHKCNNEGLEGGCPKCGRTPRKVAGQQALVFDVPTDIIPVPYQGKLWECPDPAGVSVVCRQVDEGMEKVHNKFLKGEIPAFSMFIAAPPKSGKNLFAFSCMQTALMHKFSVAPYLSTGDWQRLHKVSQMNPFYKLYGKYTWDKLIACDVVFLYVDYSDERKSSIPLMKSIMDARAAFDKPTFILSDYRLQDLVCAWKREEYTMIYNPDPNRDCLRYPVLLHRFD